MSILPTECITQSVSTLHDCSVCIIDISNNKEQPVYQELLECPICLEQIMNHDPVLILECCKNKVHLKCLCDWYNNVRQNITCFICNQVNPFGDNILQQDDSNSSDESVSISRQGSLMRSHLIQRSSRLDIQQQYTQQQYNQCKTILNMLYVTVIIFGLIIGGTVYVLES